MALAKLPGSATVPDEAFLDDRADPPAVLRVDPTRAETTSAAGPRRVLVVEQPAVGAELGMEPHRVVEAGDEDVAVGEVDAVREQDRVEQRHVARVGQHADVEKRVVGQLTRRTNPHLRLGFAPAGLALGDRDRPWVVDVAQVDGPGLAAPVRELVSKWRPALLERRQRLRLRRGRHRVLMLYAVLRDYERRGQNEDC